MRIIKEKIGNFIVATVILMIIIIAAITFFVNMNDYKESQMSSMQQLSKALVLNAESVRNEMADRYNLQIFRKDLTDPRQVVATVPVVMAWQAAQREAENAGYEFKVPKIQARNPKNEADEFERSVLKKFEEGKETEYFEVHEDDRKLHYLKPIRLTRECLLCHGDPATSKEIWGNDQGLDITGVKMENWKEGDIRGAFEVVLSLEKMDGNIRSQIITIIIILLSIFIFRVIINKFIVKPIDSVVNVVNKISDGDLTNKIEISSENEIGKMSVKLNSMIDNLNQMIKKIIDSSRNSLDYTGSVEEQISKVLAATEQTTASINTTSHTIGSITDNISSTTTNIEHQNSLVIQTNDATHQVEFSVKKVSDNAAEMSKSIGQTSAAIEEMMRNISSITENVSDVNESAKESGKTADVGKTSIVSVMQSMNKIGENMSLLVNSMENLGNRAKNIDRIVNVIDDIAEQTNLLALNAAIEAARSGEHGKGFAVVAEEVKKLAERSSKSAKEISIIIKDIQNETDKALTGTKEGFDLTTEGKQLANNAGDILNNIANKVISMTQRIQQVNISITEQNEGGNLILKEVEKLKHISGELTSLQNLQTGSIQEIVRSMNNIAQITRDINSAMVKQKNGVAQVNSSMVEINQSAQFNLKSSEKVSEEVKNLRNISNNLAQLVGKFKTC